MLRTLTLLILSLTVGSLRLHGQSLTLTPPPYESKWQIDLPVTLGSLGATGLLSYWDAQKPLPTEAFVQSLDASQVWQLDRVATRYWSPPAATFSDVLLYGSMAAPALLMISPQVRQDAGTFGSLYLQTFAVNYLTTIATKVFSQRARPYMYQAEVPLSYKLSNRDGLHSFYSGHTSTSASMCFFAAKTFADYHPDSPWRPVVWSAAALVPAATAWARVRAGKHFPTDVLVGYIAGAAIGYLVPEVHRRWAMR